MELLRKLALPLLGQVGRAQHRDAADLAAVEQFAGDEARLDGLADADVVGDEHAHRVELQRHHQRYELVGPGLDRDAAEAAEGAGGGPGGEARGVAQEPAGGEVAEVFAAGEAEGCGFDRFDGWEDAGDLLVEPADGAEHEEIGGGFGQHDPFAAACIDEGAGGEWGGCVHGSGVGIRGTDARWIETWIGGATGRHGMWHAPVAWWRRWRRWCRRMARRVGSMSGYAFG